MEKIKSPSVSGMFYPDNLSELNKIIEFFKENASGLNGFKTRAVIVPHAGYIYSGSLAYKGLSLLDKNIKTIFIFAPAHKVYFEGISLSGYDFFETPIGKIEIDRNITEEIVNNFNGKINDKAYEGEHSIEVQLPLIQNLFEKVKIVPVLIGKQAPDLIRQIISFYYKDKEKGFIVSSDLSHFLNEDEARKKDLKTAEIIEGGNLEEFSFDMACGAVSIAALSLFSREKGYSLLRVDTANSSDVTKDKTRTVGYGAWALYEGEKNKFLKEYYKDFILELCKMSIKSVFLKERIKINYPKVFDEFGACFVTLEKEGNLRGCIGSIIAHRNLISDLISNAMSAAFNDPRFTPVKEDEIESLKISVSLLSEPKPIGFKGEKDLLDKITPYKDGLIIADKGLRGVYLPSVWKQLPGKRVFLNSLKVKAGMSPNYFSDTFEAYRFESEYLEKP